jgi:hypothetical protein
MKRVSSTEPAPGPDKPPSDMQDQVVRP